MERKIALVTGASGGIGGACAARLAGEGYTVLLHGSGHLSRARDRAASLCAQGYDAHAVGCDLGDAGDTQRMCGEILSLWHGIDALVCCAGVSYTGLLQEMTEEAWQRVISVNLTGVYRLCRAFLPGMVSRRRGAVVTVSSMWGRSGASCEAAYSAAKAGIIGLTQALAKEVGPSGVRVNCVAPGVIDTAMMAEHSSQTKRELAEETPLGRLGTPEDVAGAVSFLLSDVAAFITGQTLGVDGGFL